MARFARPADKSPTLTRLTRLVALPVADDDANGKTLRHHLKLVTLAWVFGSFWLWTITGATMTQFAKALETPEWAFGILAALPFVGTLAQLPASWFLERFGRRRLLFLWGASISRFAWTLVALVPWVLPDTAMRHWWWPTMMVILTMSWLLGQAAAPAWMSWMSDLIPRRLRGRYFGFRNFISQPLAIAFSLGVGWSLDMAMSVSTTRPGIMLQVTSAVLAIAGLLGTLDILCFRGVPDNANTDEKSKRALAGQWLGMLATPLRDRNFRVFLAYNFTLILSLGFLGQYVWLFVLDEAKLSNWTANLCLIVIPGILRAIAFPFWGKLMDQLGKKPVIMMSGALILFGPVGWFFVNEEYLLFGYALTLLSPLVFPGLEMANFNVLLDMSGTKGGRQGGTAYVAVNSIAIAIGGTLSGIIGAVVAGQIADFRFEMPSLGIIVTYHGVLILISIALRGAALVWASQLHEPKATGTRDAVRVTTSMLWSNTRQALLMPSRGIGNLRQISYRLRR